MLLSAKTIRRLILDGVRVQRSDGTYTTKALIDPVPADRLEFIEGSAYDLTLAAVHFHQREHYHCAEIGTDYRLIPPTEPAFLSKEDPRNLGREGWWLILGGCCLLESAETVNIPINLNGVIKPRTSLFRSFATVTCSDAHPNYQGKIVILVQAAHSIWLEKSCRFASIKFEQFDSEETDAYRGIWSGDKITTEGQIERGH